MPLPLYGSGGLTDLMSAATCPTFCLSIPDITISVWLGVSIVIPLEWRSELDENNQLLIQLYFISFSSVSNSN